MQRFLPYRGLRFAARRVGVDWERARFMNPQLDDVEAELTYLRVRALRPRAVVEVSPFRGWSTTWILRALRDNDSGALTSFDLHDSALTFVPQDLGERWRLVVGDVRDRLDEMPERIDYLFVDADHGAAFARWYIDELMPRVSGGVSVHDVFHRRRPERRGDGEARVVLEWLRREGIAWITPSRLAPGDCAERIATVRSALDLGRRIHFSDHDSMVLFDLS